VDDQPGNLLALEAVLEDPDRIIVRASSGEEALRRLLERDFAVVLLDVRMPGLDGFETARLIRGRERSRATPIIFLTAHDDDSLSAERAYALGAVDYLVKPLVPVILRAKVAGFIDLFLKTEQVKRQADQLLRMERGEFQRSLAEENARLRDSERRFRTLATHVPVGIFQTDPLGDCTFVNDRWCRLAGLDPHEAAGDGWLRALHPDDRDRVQGEWYAAAAAGREFDAEYRFRTPEGRTAWVHGRAVALRGDAGEVTGHLGTVSDITEQKAARDALRGSEERLRTLSDNLPDGAVYQTVATPDGGRRFAFISAGVERLFGVTPAEAVADAASLYGLVHADDRDRLAAAEAVALRDQAPFDCEFRSRTRGGGVRWVHCRSAPRRLPTGEAVWEGIVMDVTARRRAEAESRAGAERLDLVVNSVDLGLWYCDLPFDKLVWNAKVKEHFGLPADADVTIDTFYERLHPDDRGRTRAAIDASIRDRTGYDIEYRTVGLDGRVRWVRAIGQTFYGPTGSPVRFDGITVDVTERVRQEQALREADRRKDQWVMMLAHELRNPLAPIRTGLELLHAADAGRPAVEKARRMMDRQVGHLTRIIEDLLDVSRLIRGRVELRPERLDLGRLARTAVEDQEAAFDRAGLTVATDLPELPVWVNGDPTRLTQVLDNLLQNAVKFTDRGGTVTVRVEADAGGERAVLAVQDTGVGIEADMLPRLFETFAQADTSLDRSKGGLGLGLSVVKGLVELHNGTAEARSDGPGRGSEFVVRLPLVPEPAAVSDMPTAPERAARRLRVLVVEDNRDAADSLVMLLEVFGYEVAVAYTGPSGVAAATAWGPDAVVCDIGLPGLDGYGVARALRGNPATAEARMIAVTGYGGEDDRLKSREAGFDAHLTKPADPAEIRRLLATAGGN